MGVAGVPRRLMPQSAETAGRGSDEPCKEAARQPFSVLQQEGSVRMHEVHIVHAALNINLSSVRQTGLSPHRDRIVP